MTVCRFSWGFALVALLAAGAVHGQSSASYELSEHTFNSGGNPGNYSNPSSGGYEISLSALGDTVSSAMLEGASYSVEGGFVPAYRAPGEVDDLRFTSKVGLTWGVELSAGTYNLYRALINSLSTLTYGACEQHAIGTTSTTDSDPLTTGSGHFYLVTVENRLSQEGTKGFDSSGTQRSNAAPCP